MIHKNRIFILLIALSFSVGSFSQSFTGVADLTGSTYGTCQWVDYDSDGDLDIFTTGGGTNLYRNDGGSVFTWVVTGISSISVGGASWGDYDNDGDPDLAITGSSGSKITKIYRNDGGSFVDINAGLTGLDYSTVAWGDYDNDGKPDLLVSGLNDLDEPVAILYHNDGGSVFTDSEIAIVPCVKGTAKWGDYNNDDLLDLLLIGQDFNGNAHTGIMRNNGESFISINDGIADGFRGVADWGDYDNDGDLDVIVGGQMSGTHIYRNDGSDTFTDINAGLPPLSYCAVAWGDYDNDGDPDAVITGVNVGNGQNYTLLYQNKGNDIFTEDVNSLVDLSYGSLAWGDYDNDGDVDLLITGSSGSSFARVYRNNTANINAAPTVPTGILSTVVYDGAILRWNSSTDAKTPSNGLTYNVRIGTISNGINTMSPMSNMTTGFRKIAWQGNAMLGNKFYIRKLPVGIYYWSVQSVDPSFKGSAFSATGSFTIQAATTDMNVDILLLQNSSSSWGDCDKDGDMDLLITGRIDPTGIFASKIYRNNGGGIFDTINAKLTGVEYGSCDWGDFDNDGDLDILLSGNTGPYGNAKPISRVYRNNGNNTYTNINASLTGTGSSSCDWGDYDNDGDLDILLTGADKSAIYRNDGDSKFTDIKNNIILTNQGSASWGDFDRDNDLDALVFGNSQTKIYRNDGSDTFTAISQSLPGTSEGSALWGDYNNDGFLDIFMTGSFNNYNYSRVYQNNGNGTFSLTDAVVRGVSESSGVWGDFNNDGYQDLFFTGRSGNFISKVCINDKKGKFTDIYAPLAADYRSKISTADYDNDGDLDFFITMYGSKPKLFRNNMNFPNDLPSAPSSLQIENSGMGVIMSWNPSTDGQNSSGLYYNIRLGNTSNSYDLISPMVIMPGYKRLIPSIGNAQSNNSWKIDSLPEGKYYWSVQAIDPSFAAGPWAAEQSFDVTLMRPYFTFDTVCLGSLTHFTDQTIFTGTQIQSWHWDFGDGQTSDVQNPEYSFSTAGTFQVKMEVTDTAGIKLTKTNSVLVLPAPEAMFSVNNVCIGGMVSAVNISNTDTLIIDSWRWNFGDGNISILKYPGPHGYLNAGNYSIALKVTARNGCADTAINVVTVASYPVAAVSANAPLSFCEGDSVVLSVPYNKEYQYQWKLDDTNLTNGDTSRFSSKLSGSYTVEVLNPAANCLSASVAVKVTARPGPFAPVVKAFNYTQGVCPGENPVRLSAEQESDEYKYLWFKDGVAMLRDTLSYMNTYEAGNYRLVAYKSGCLAESTLFPINFPEAFPKPVIYAQGPNIWYMACSNTGADFYKWYYNGNLIEGANRYIYVANQKLGQYQVSIGNSQRCFVRSDVISIPEYTGYNNELPGSLMAGEINIYPNPAAGSFTINIDNEITGEVEFSISDYEGKKTGIYKYEKDSPHFSARIDPGRLPIGNYLLFIRVNKKSAVRKIIIDNPVP